MTERRGRPALRPEQDIAEPPREVVHVDSIPSPIEVQVPGGPTPQRTSPLNLEETVLNILKEEFDELSLRLERFGVPFDTRMQQELVDVTMALLAGFVSGGTLARR